MTSERLRIIRVLRSWLEGANPEAVSMNIEPSTDIIESRVLESLQVVEFILFIEAQSGRVVLSEDLNPDHLRTLDSICDHFFEELP